MLKAGHINGLLTGNKLTVFKCLGVGTTTALHYDLSIFPLRGKISHLRLFYITLGTVRAIFIYIYSRMPFVARSEM